MRMTLWFLGLAAVLSGCSSQDDRICRPVDKDDPAIMQCLQRAAYKLREAPGANRDIADAAVTSCGDKVWQAARETAEVLNQINNEATPVDFEEANGLAHDWALKYVVEARAGNCDPLKEGKPDNASDRATSE